VKYMRMILLCIAKGVMSYVELNNVYGQKKTKNKVWKRDRQRDEERHCMKHCCRVAFLS
jgi:hypothetical protein